MRFLTSPMAWPVSMFRRSSSSATAATDQIEHVVAGDHGHGAAGTSRDFQGLAARPGAAQRVESARIGDHAASPAVAPVGGDRADDVEEVVWPAGLRVARALQGQDRHRDLRQEIEGQEVQIGLPREHLAGRVEAVAPETTGIANTNRSGHTFLKFARSRGNAVTLCGPMTTYSYTCSTPVRNGPQVDFSGIMPRAAVSHCRVSCGAMIASTQPRAAP